MISTTSYFQDNELRHTIYGRVSSVDYFWNFVWIECWEHKYRVNFEEFRNELPMEGDMVRMVIEGKFKVWATVIERRSKVNWQKEGF